MRLNLKTVGIGAVLVFLFPLVCDAAVREYFAADDFDITEGRKLTVDGWDLEIHVRGADTESVRCTTDLRISGIGADKAGAWIASRTPRFSQSDDGLDVATETTDDGFFVLGKFMRRGRLGLVTPLSTIPDITTSTGAIKVRGDFFLGDPVLLRTSTGDIYFSGAAPSMEIRTTSGAATIEVTRPLKRLWARTSSGSLILSGGAENVEIETASGDVTLNALSGSAVVETVGGSINVHWDRLPTDAVIRLRTSKGDLIVTLPQEAQPSGRLSTSNGEILSEFPGEVGPAGDTVVLTGKGPILDIETASGTLKLVKDPGWFAPKE